MSFRLASAFVELGTRDKGMRQGFSSAQSFVSSSLTNIGRIAAGLGLGLTFAGLIRSSREWIQLAGVQERTERRLESVIKATGGAVGFTADELKQFASELQNVTTTGDETILRSMALLLTFKSVSGDVFKRATEAALDLAATGFGSVEGNMVQMGKALEDPIRGLTALRRSGVSFTEEQKKQIETLVKTGKLQRAQALVLDAVEGQVKGVARELAKTDIGKYDQLANKLGDVKEVLGQAVIPLFVQFREVQLGTFQGMIPAIEFWANTVAGAAEHAGKSLKRWGFTDADAQRGWLQTMLDSTAILGVKSLDTAKMLTAQSVALTAETAALIFPSLDKMADAASASADDFALRFARDTLAMQKAMDEARAAGKFKAGNVPGFPGLSEASGAEPRVPSGFFGFDELSKRIQEQTLKTADPQKKMAGLMEADQVVQKRMAAALDKVATNTAPVANPLNNIGLATE